METKLQQEINDVLKAFPEYWKSYRTITNEEQANITTEIQG